MKKTLLVTVPILLLTISVTIVLAPRVLANQETIYTCNTSDVQYETLYVSSDAGTAQNGTIEEPFESISSALHFAEIENITAVQLQIGPGVYGDDSVMVSRPTRILGPGQSENPTAELSLSIINPGGHELGIQGVVFRAASSGPAIAVSDSFADTALCDVRFESVTGHALLQTGGNVVIDGGEFNSTSRDPLASSDDHLTGTAIVLSGGVTGSITDILADGNSGSGLHVSGIGTQVNVDWEESTHSVFQNGTGCLGAVVVQDGAELNASHLTVNSNAVLGIDAGGTGTSVNLLFLTATSTQFIAGNSDITAEVCGFNAVSNVRTSSGAILKIAGSGINPFIISDSDLAGLIVVPPSSVSLSNGIIRNNPIGAAVLNLGVNNFDCLFSEDNVAWVNNVNDFQADILTPPEPLREWACKNDYDDDQDGNTDCQDTDCQFSPDCNINNNPPNVDAGGPYTGSEGEVIDLIGASAFDPENNPLTFNWSLYGTDQCTFSNSGILNPEITCDENGLFSAEISAEDNFFSVSSIGCVFVYNASPQVGEIAVTQLLLSVGDIISTNVEFTDPGIYDTHIATWDWGDGNVGAGTVIQGAGFGEVEGNHIYNEPGVYTIEVDVTDDDSGSAASVFQYVIVYDPEGGFVTGGGWIDSPEGAYKPDETLSGKATFGFVSKYKKGATVPEGNTEFQFNVAKLNFHSSNYQWLVVAGNTAKFKGVGTINGSGEYKFQIWAEDGESDVFRIKIWTEDEDGVENVVYDNGFEGSGFENGQPISGGSIIVHTK